MRILLAEVWDFIVDLWDTGNHYIRLAIVLVLGWPIAMTLAVLAGVNGDAAVALALLPAGSLILLLLVIPPMLPVLLVALPERPFDGVRFLDRVRFPSRTQRLRGFKRTLQFLMLVAGIELAVGIYLAGVPVSNDPGLILWLLAFAVVFVLLWFGGVRHKWLTRAFAITFLAITAIFFLGGRQEVRGWKEERQRREIEQIVAAQAALAPKEYTLNAGEERMTVLVGPGTLHRIQANKPWLAVSTLPDGTTREYRHQSGSSSWKGGLPEGLLIVKGVEDGTILRFERVR